jgi:pimeloyl-ACP methyl ester carboxylesterase
VLRERLSSVIDFDYLEAPIEVTPPQSLVERAKKPLSSYRVWYKYIEQERKCLQWRQSLSYVIDYCEANGPYDGVLCFSMGCVMGTLLTNLCHRYWTQQQDWMVDEMQKIRGSEQLFSKQVPFKFAILVGGFYANDAEMQNYFDKNIVQVPSLHCMGTQDQMIIMERSQRLAQAYNDKQKIFIHNEGHVVPHTDDFISEILTFVTKTTVSKL